MSLHNVGPGPIGEMKFRAVFAGIKYYDFFFSSHLNFTEI